ncbi:hypothetical protein R1flu_014820 [Riccia fluitans]|uniref:Ribosomal protein S14 n=1 Tax=Riccia fluitans TaxID=41844 RepID=A0ABD1YIB0_9MARC
MISSESSVTCLGDWKILLHKQIHGRKARCVERGRNVDLRRLLLRPGIDSRGIWTTCGSSKRHIKFII